MNKKVYGVYLELIGSRVCNLLIKEKNIDENIAIELFISSNIYKVLSDEDTGLISVSPNKIYDLLIEELRKNGKLNGYIKV